MHCGWLTVMTGAHMTMVMKNVGCFIAGGSRSSPPTYRDGSRVHWTLVEHQTRHRASVLCVREWPVSSADNQVSWRTDVTSAACRQHGWRRHRSRLGDARRDCGRRHICTAFFLRLDFRVLSAVDRSAFFVNLKLLKTVEKLRHEFTAVSLKCG